MRYVLLLATAVVMCGATRGFGKPALGYNNCNLECCSDSMPSSAFFRDTALAMVRRGLFGAGYNNLNMDDCWMLPHRANNGTGPQVPDPAKFPEGIANLSKFAHGLGMKFGLYTAQAGRTCGGKVGSCGFEAVDASQYAAWGVDYVKDDRCGGCSEVLKDIEHMQDALDSTGRTIFLSVEGNPDVAAVSANPSKYGNTRRVGHDIMATWYSMLSLVDTGSGLWPFAHNDTGLGGYFNDLDIMELGNIGHFRDAGDRSRSHFTMWVVMKAPILLGCNLTDLSDELVAMVTNAEALAIHQDPLGKQARRVASVAPDVEPQLFAEFDAVLALVPCNASRPTQKWRLNATDKTIRTTDSHGRDWCMGPSSIPWGRPYEALPCDDPRYAHNASQQCGPPNVCITISEWEVHGDGHNVSFESTTGGGTLGWDNTEFASGPLPHSRWMMDSKGLFQWSGTDPHGSSIRPMPGLPLIYDDDQVG
eukprot:Hpha_TRINITY_DN9306_c0_g1::TRINITY_DN9306_c0_g1_i1::g.25915::m.25915/K07407/E3.2.1.22B, galA, rafA; alpha-galactosidase